MEIKLQARYTRYLLPAVAAFTVAIAIATTVILVATKPPARTVLVATRDLAEGTRVQPSDFHAEELQIGTYASNYLSKIGEGQILTQPVLKGELLNKRSLTVGQSPLIPIRLNGLRPIAKSISVGDRVDIWATGQNHSLNPPSPEAVAYDAIVTAIESNTTMTQSSTTVEIRISVEYLETLLSATDSNAQLSIILHETLADY